MSFLDDSAISCGVGQLHGLYSSEESVLAVKDDDDYAIVVFSDTIRNKNGSKLANYIRKHGLGHVSASAVRRNSNSGNRIRVWTWAVDRRALKRWNP